MVERGLAEGPWSLTDHGKKAEQRLNGHPYDLEAWNVLIREAQVTVNENLAFIYLTHIPSHAHTHSLQSTAILRARMLYERVVTQFPSSGRYWRLYIEQEVTIAYRNTPLLLAAVPSLCSTATVLRCGGLRVWPRLACVVMLLAVVMHVVSDTLTGWRNVNQFMGGCNSEQNNNSWGR